MSRHADVSVLVATDGSRAAIAAVAIALAFPWPARTRVSAVVARRPPVTFGRPQYVLDAYDRHWDHVAASARRALAHRWPDADVKLVDDSPADAILGEAKQRGADVIVMGWRGHGALRRLLIGSVSRTVVHGASASVLVTRKRPADLRRFVVGVDGSPGAARAVDFLARCTPPRGGQIVVVSVREPVALPSLGMMPASVRDALRREAAEVAKARDGRSRKAVDAALARLQNAGWKARAVARTGYPLHELLATVDAVKGDMLVVGARGVSAVERLLLGSVAEGALAHAKVPVLVAR